MPQTEAPKVLKIGYTHYEPMNYMDEKQGMLMGFDTEFARKVCDDLGYTAEFVEIIWENKVRDLEVGTIDCIWNGMSITDELQEKILVSEPYLANRQVAVVPKTDQQESVSVLDFEAIAFENGGVAEDLLVRANLPYSVQRQAATQSAALAEVLAGNVKMALVDYIMAKCLVGKGVYKDLSFVEIEESKTELFGIGFRKEDSELCQSVNELIRQYQADGTFAAWETKYLG